MDALNERWRPHAAHERIDVGTQEERNGSRFESREIEAVVAQSVHFVARMPAGSTGASAQLLDDVRRLVEVAVGRREELDELARRELVQLGARRRSGCARRPARRPVSRPCRYGSRLVWRLATSSGVNGALVRRRRRREDADAVALRTDVGLRTRARSPRDAATMSTVSTNAPSESRRSRCVGSPAGSVRCGVEVELDAVRPRTSSRPRLRVVRGRRAAELRLERPSVAQVAHATAARVERDAVRGPAQAVGVRGRGHVLVLDERAASACGSRPLARLRSSSRSAAAGSRCPARAGRCPGSRRSPPGGSAPA